MNSKCNCVHNVVVALKWILNHYLLSNAYTIVEKSCFTLSLSCKSSFTTISVHTFSSTDRWLTNLFIIYVMYVMLYISFDERRCATVCHESHYYYDVIFIPHLKRGKKSPDRRFIPPVGHSRTCAHPPKLIHLKKKIRFCKLWLNHDIKLHC